MHHRWRAAGKGLGHRAVFVSDLICTAKKPPCEGDRCGLGQGGVQRGEAVIAAVDVDEFIDVKRQDPIGLLHKLQVGRGLQRGELNAALLIGAVVADVGHAAKRLQPVEHRIRAVVAIVGKDQHMVETDGAVMRQPF